MGKLLDRLRKSKNLQNILKLSSGTLAAQIISFGTLPVFTRLFGDEIIGNWAFLNTICMIVHAFSDLGLSNALMMEPNEEEMNQTYRVVSTLGLLFGLFSGIIFFLTGSAFSISPAGVTPLFGSAFLCCAVFTERQIAICSTRLNRDGGFSILMKNQVISNLVFGVVGLGLAVMGFREHGYFIGWLAGQTAALLQMLHHIKGNLLVRHPGEIVQVIKRNKHYVLYQMPSNAILNIRWQIPQLLIKTFFGSSALGQYSIANRLVNVPVNLLGMSIGRVFFQNAAERKRSGDPISDFTNRNLTTAIKLAVIPVSLIMSLGDLALSLFLGSGWNMAANIIRVIALQAFFAFLILVVQGLPIILEKQKYTMFLSLAQMAATVGAVSIGAIAFNSLYVGLALMSALCIISNIIYFTSFYRIMEIPGAKFLKMILTSILVTFILYALIRIPLVLLNVVLTL